MHERIVGAPFAVVYLPYAVDVDGAVRGSGRKYAGIESADNLAAADKERDRVRAYIRDYDVIAEVFRNGVGNPEFFGACLMRVYLESRVGRGISVNAGDDHRGNAAAGYLVIDFRAAADVLPRAFAGDDTAVFDGSYIGYLRDCIAHGVADGDTLNIVNGAEFFQLSILKGDCIPARDFEMIVARCKTHCGCSVINAYEHNLNTLRFLNV